MWFRANQVTATSGSKIVVVNSGEDVGVVSANDGLIVGTFLPVEIKSAYANANGDQIIELLYGWSDSTQTTVPAKVIPTAGDFVAATAALRNATENTRDNYKTMDDWGSLDADTDIGYGKGIVEFTGADNVKHKARSMQKMDEDVDEAIDELIGTKDSVFAMTKADFFALAEKRIRDNAGSGFAEWGKHGLANVTEVPINEGMWQDLNSSAHANSLKLGADSSLGSIDASSVSRTNYPITQVNGVAHVLNNINTYNVNKPNNIKFPPAPDGTKSYDSATGIVTQHASAAEAFEGLVTNGDFRNGDDDWTNASSGGSTVESEDGNLKLTSDSASNVAKAFQRLNSTTVGVELVMKIAVGDVTNASDNEARVFVSGGGGGNLPLPANQVSTFRFTYNTDMYIEIQSDQEANATAIIHSVSVMPATEKVITSRQDYVFMESWHEKISDKGQVYPLGNVQYGASSYEGISLLTRDDGYTRFGEWDDTTTGRYAVWDDLNFAEKDIFLSDPNNNIYKDGDDLIQVRYRIRVIEGMGDEWESTIPTGKSDTDRTPYVGWMCYFDGSNQRIGAKGALTTADDYRDGSTGTGLYATQFRSPSGHSGANGIFEISGGSSYAHNGICLAVPIALVQRRNQGAYHPALNPNGCARLIRSDGSSTTLWHSDNSLNEPTSMSDLFILPTDGYPFATGYVWPESGSISGQPSGRSDEKFFNAIYASDVEDLRMSSRRVPVAEIREQYKRKAIAGEIRGFEGVPFTKTFFASSTQDGGNFLVKVDVVLGENPSDSFEHYVYSNMDGVWVGGRAVVYSGDVRFLKVIPAPVIGFKPNIERDCILSSTQLSATSNHKQANPTWTDIIGDPVNIAALITAQGWSGIEGQWIPEIPDGTVKTYTMTRKVTSSTPQNNRTERTLDNGVTWEGTPWNSRVVFDSTTNSFVSAATTATVALWHYETQAHFTEDDVNSEVIELGSVSATQGSSASGGTIVTSSLIGKVPTYPFSNGTIMIVPLGSENTIYGKLNDGDFMRPFHTSLNLSIVGGASKAVVKTLDYLSEENGVGKLCYAYKEMVYDDTFDPTAIRVSGNTSYSFVAGIWYQITSGSKTGYYLCTTSLTIAMDSQYLHTLPNGDIISDGGTGIVYFESWDGNGWGDNNQFEIVNNQESFTDDNGNTGLRGTASFKTQYFIDKSN